MSGLEGNKILAAVLLGGTIFVGANIVTSDFLFGHHGHKFNPADHYAVPAVASATTAVAAPTGPEPVAELLATADIASGESIFSKKCTSCHVNEAGAKLKSAPNLWGVVDRAYASTEFGKYSASLKKLSDKAWTTDELNEFLYKPKSYIKGTSMAFGGLRKTQERADIIAYLQTLK